MKNKIVITVPKLSAPGGVSAFWNALLPEMNKWEDVLLDTLEIGGHGKNLLGPLQDQLNFRKVTKSELDLVVLNPSLGSRSFFRDGLFAKRLVKKNIKFVVFFHGWDAQFEKKVTKKYISFFQTSFGQATRIFVLSDDFKQKLKQWGYQGTVVVETTTVDKTLLADFSGEEKFRNMARPSEVKILFLSRLLREKGIYETIEAFKVLRHKFPKIELVIAGDGKEFDAVSVYIANDNGIQMVGHVQGVEKINLFKNCHIYCLPSYSEGLPTSVLEAMAFGLPVVTTPVGGLKDFFQDEKMGHLVDLNEKNGLEQKLALLIADIDQLIEIGKYNSTYAAENLISDVVAQRLYGHFMNSISDSI